MKPLSAAKRAGRFLRKYARASRAVAYAERRGAPGTQFARFGRRIGVSLLRTAPTVGIAYLLTPVNITRYFEFDFVHRNLLPRGTTLLDVSSPRLFALYVAKQRPSASIEMLNPDSSDAETTRLIVDRLGYQNVAVSAAAVSELSGHEATYDCIWSISVVEHISTDGGEDDGDTQAMRLMYGALRPGGRLIVTVPVDRRFWKEFRDRDYYGVDGLASASGRYFFQRLYDEASLRFRLVEPLGAAPTTLAWFGERIAGTFYAYQDRWISHGPAETIDDARRIADDYVDYGSWADMPGFGICGLVIDKPKTKEIEATR